VKIINEANKSEKGEQEAKEENEFGSIETDLP
jgi:hypothetical protein